MAETVEQLHLLLGVAADLVVGREVTHELFDASPKLVREVRRRRSDERVDVVAGDLGHLSSVSLPSAAVRRLSAAEVGLVITIVAPEGEALHTAEADIVLSPGRWRIVDEQSFMLVATTANGNRLQLDALSLDPSERRN